MSQKAYVPPIQQRGRLLVRLRRDASPRRLLADYISKPHAISGINFGDGPTAVVFAVAVTVLVLYLAVARPDIQPGVDTSRDDKRSLTLPPDTRYAIESEHF